jgi:hypothetical protein
MFEIFKIENLSVNWFFLLLRSEQFRNRFNKINQKYMPKQVYKLSYEFT